jgi:phage shock protein C
MICANCQREIAEYSNFCYYCGSRQKPAAPQSSAAGKRLRRSATDCKIAGVCGGFAEYFEVDSTVVRLVWVFLVLLPIPVVPALLGYIAAWIIMPRAPLPAAAPTQSAASQAAPSN